MAIEDLESSSLSDLRDRSAIEELLRRSSPPQGQMTFRKKKECYRCCGSLTSGGVILIDL